MRNAFIEELIVQAKQDSSIFLIVGDLGYGVVEEFASKYPNQFLNAGVAEQNMMGMAAGIASAGYKVFVYSIANFPTFRCFEQLRNDVCYHDFNVTIVAVGAGLSYGSLGYSHHAIEDIAVLRALPGLKIMSPADPVETRQALQYALKNEGPKYLRLGKNGEPKLFSEQDSRFPNASSFGSPNAKIKLISSGAILNEALEARNLLEVNDIYAQVINVPLLKPFTLELDLMRNAEFVVSIEEHSIAGGLGTLVSEYVLQNDLLVKVLCLGLPDEVQSLIGSQAFLREHFGISGSKIANRIRAFLTGHAE